MKKTLYAAIGIGAIALGLYAAEPRQSHDAAINRSLNTFNSVVRQLEGNYVDSIRTQEAIEAAIYAYTSTIDPYTEYYNSSDAEKFSTMTTGDYGGIGSYIMERDGWVYISGPYAGSPAEKSGLMAGDKLLRIDTVDLKGVKSDRVSALLKGTPGTTVTVTVNRPWDQDSIKTFKVEREKLHMPSVPYYGMIGDDIGYVKLDSYMEKSAEEIKEALESFRKEKGLQGIIFDLRSNGGGLLTGAVEILGYFLPKNTEVLTTKGKGNVVSKTYKTPRTPILPDTPLVVLIDGGTASAAEITSGALQDLDRAVLMGSRSYGKGLVQSTFELPYDELLKVTTAKYYIPSGRLIQAVDYSKRNVDGTAQRVPDSLTNVFHTRNGREVRDGGGLTPDIKIEPKKYPQILISLVRDNWMFDFITKYRSEHPEVASPEEFVLTDDIYEEFKGFINPEKFKVDQPATELLKRLRTSIEDEGMMTDDLQVQLDSLGSAISLDLSKDMDRLRPEIEPYLASQMMDRYYHDKGSTLQQIKYDPEIRQAIELLRNPVEYNKILQPKKKK